MSQPLLPWQLLQGLVPFGWWSRLSGQTLVLPYYHMVTDEAVPHVRNLYQFKSVRAFEQDVEFFARHLRPVELADIVADLDGRRSLPADAFHLSFDDGFRQMHDVVAPILLKKGIPATFFLNTAFLDQGGLALHNVIGLIIERLKRPNAKRLGVTVAAMMPQAWQGSGDVASSLLAAKYADRELVASIAETAGVDVDDFVRHERPYLTSEQVQSLIKKGFTIGGHSHDHPLYSDIRVEEQLEQTKRCIDILHSRFGLKTRAFAFPHTDTGVGEPFFDSVFESRELDVTFGTGGMVRHFHPRNLQRVGLERTSASVGAVLARQHTRAAYRRVSQ